MDVKTRIPCICFLALIAVITYSTAKRIAVCKNQARNIFCGAGTRIHIIEASYGRRRSACGLSPTWYCNSWTDATDIVGGQCNGQAFCAVQGSDDDYGNACMFGEKFLDLRYECQGPPTTQAPITAVQTTQSSIKIAQICERRMGMVKCPQGNIKVNSAFYGRRSSLPCQYGDTSFDNQCTIDAMWYANKYCHGKPACFLKSTSSIFGDPCYGRSKYLQIEYECETTGPPVPTTTLPTTTPPTTTTTAPTTVSPYRTAQVCDGRTAFVKCFVGKIFVVSAFYGRKSSRICPNGNTNNVNCEKNVFQYAKFFCHGKSLCFPAANSAALGDPCPGTSKYFRMEYECKDASAFTTQAPTTKAVTKIFTPPPPVPPGVCGKTYVQQSRIVGGKGAKAGAWPWQAAVYNKGSYKTVRCGASLINSRWLVTATHCFQQNPAPDSYEVVMGEHDRSRPEGSEVRSAVERIVLHPAYNQNHTYNNDIALIKLARPMIMNTRIAPVCLPKQGVNVPLGTMCYLSGWGMVTYPSNSATILQQGQIPIVSQRECARQLRQSALPDGLSISDKMLCAGYNQYSSAANRDVSACRGDSGGPFVCQNNQGDWILQGAVSWGSIRCLGTDRYSVFARVSEFRDWIDNIIAADGQPATTEAPPQPPVVPSSAGPATPAPPQPPVVPSSAGPASPAPPQPPVVPSSAGPASPAPPMPPMPAIPT